MTDLDIGMNQRLAKPLKWDDSRSYDRGKVMTAEMLDAGKEFGRYLDVDGDGIPFRTYPGTHPIEGRATSRAARARTPTRSTRRRARTTSTTCSAC